MNQRILVVDDEQDIQELVAYNLTKNGYEVIRANTGEEALQLARTESPDLVVLDLMLPGIDGLDCCRVLKNDPFSKHLPVMMLTAKGEDADIVVALNMGADDYVTKPFSPQVLLARIEAVLRRRRVSAPDPDEELTLKELSIHPARHEVRVDGELVELTAGQFAMLHFLCQRPGWVFSRAQIINALKGKDYSVTDRSVDVQVVALRKRLGRAGRIIETVRGVGYRVKE